MVFQILENFYIWFLVFGGMDWWFTSSTLGLCSTCPFLVPRFCGRSGPSVSCRQSHLSYHLQFCLAGLVGFLFAAFPTLCPYPLPGLSNPSPSDITDWRLLPLLRAFPQLPHTPTRLDLAFTPTPMQATPTFPPLFIALPPPHPTRPAPFPSGLFCCATHFCLLFPPRVGALLVGLYPHLCMVWFCFVLDVLTVGTCFGRTGTGVG